MKRILVLAKNREEDTTFTNFLSNNLREVFENMLQIEIAFLDELQFLNFSLYDLVLIMPHELIHQLHSFLQGQYEKEKLLLPSRTFSNNALERINAIPPGSKVLVRNRKPYTTMETIRLLYQLGVTHLDLVTDDGKSPIKGFDYVITSGTAPVPVPPGTTVVATGFRQLDSYAFIDIASHLNIPFERISRNLIKYLQQLPFKHTDIEKWYLDAQMSNKVLDRIMSKTDFGVIVTDLHSRIVYCNEKSQAIFNGRLQKGVNFEIPEQPGATERLFGPDVQHELLQIGTEHIMVERQPLFMEDNSMGYYFEFQTAQRISSMGSKLSRKLHDYGLYAKYNFEDIIYRSSTMQECVKVARKLASTDYSILISGESGAGKELFAQSIHNASSRARGPFVAVNCAAFPESLLESELFGYEGGAFTGSNKNGKMGLFELANKGSIFLDEIGDMPLSLQGKLLRVIQEKKLMRIGSGKVIDVDTRVISASNKSLLDEIEAKQFRADLYYRLSTFTIEIPPLRNRQDDIVPLFCRFAKCSSAVLCKKDIESLQKYHWPGNVRELQNVAAYYNVIGNLGVLSRDITRTTIEQHPRKTDEFYREAILAILREHQDEGFGRHRLMNLLNEKGNPISENRFEVIIHQMVADGLVHRGRGRSGIRLCKQ